jgi:hypothetical protein
MQLLRTYAAPFPFPTQKSKTTPKPPTLSLTLPTTVLGNICQLYPPNLLYLSSPIFLGFRFSYEYLHFKLDFCIFDSLFNTKYLL